MKTFQYEVLTFDATRSKDFEAMRATLNEWGAEGFEVASVVTPTINANVYTVFLSREAGSKQGSEVPG